MKAIVHVGLKPGVLDPQGKAVADSLGRMGFGEVASARIGKGALASPVTLKTFLEEDEGLKELGGPAYLVRLAGAALFIWMGWQVIKNADKPPAEDSRLTRPGVWPGFAAGVAAILGNPKAILFYLGVLPGFFDLARLTMADTIVIVGISVLVPFAGNLLLAGFVDRVRALLTTPRALRRLNIGSGALLIGVGLVLPVI